MLDVFKQLITNQFEATLCTLDACVEACPDTAWNGPVVNLKFCQVAFHTLFFTDYYLGVTEEPFRQQAFHRQHAAVFRDYEELEPREQVLSYEKPWIKIYAQFCREKAVDVMKSETAESLAAPSRFPNKPFTRAEHHVYNIRHIQHHAAQLSMRLRLDSQIDIRWVRSGWNRSVKNEG
jgi:hypothetical protein